MNEQLETTIVRLLNSAYKADPEAVHALLVNRVPCNKELSDHPYIQVHRSQTLDDNAYNVGLLGIINGILSFRDRPFIQAKWEDGKFIGFRVDE